MSVWYEVRVSVLDVEQRETPGPCPVCGAETMYTRCADNLGVVDCDSCGMIVYIPTRAHVGMDTQIRAYNQWAQGRG